MAYIYGHPEIKQIGTEGKGKMFEGKRCLITGASSGIGYGLAERLLQRGAEVWLCSRTESRMKAAAETLSAQYGADTVFWRVIDVLDAEALVKFADDMAAAGPIDYLFANAGIGSSFRFEKCTRQQFDAVFATNFYGVFNADKAVIDHMIGQGFGHILNVSSIEGVIPSGYHTAYTASKHAVLGMTEDLRYEFEERNIKFSCILPGPVFSDIWGRAIDGSVHPHGQPADGITGLESADEILAGIEDGYNIILVTDKARRIYNWTKVDPEAADKQAHTYTERQIAGIRATEEAMKKMGK